MCQEYFITYFIGKNNDVIIHGFKYIGTLHYNQGLMDMANEYGLLSKMVYIFYLS